MDAVTFQTRAMELEKLMYQVSWSMLRNQEDCADAVQEALTRAWQKRDTLKNEERFRPWMMQILSNTCRDMLRRRKKIRFVPMEEQTMYADPPQGPLPLNEAMDRLPADMRVLISLHYLGGFGLRDIASLLKIPLGTVKTRVSRARKQLSVYLSEEWEDDLQ